MSCNLPRLATIACIVIVLVQSAALCQTSIKTKSEEHADFIQGPFYMQRLTAFLNDSSQARIVIVGDSITANGKWEELLHRSDLVNRGIPGDTTGGILTRLDSIFNARPKCIFYLAGINDITATVPAEDILSNIKAFIQAAKDWKASIWVGSILLTDNEKVNREVRKVNALIKTMCKAKRVPFVDLNVALSDGDSKLQTSFTYDGLHLNDRGYEILGQEVRQALYQCAP